MLYFSFVEDKTPQLLVKICDLDNALDMRKIGQNVRT